MAERRVNNPLMKQDMKRQKKSRMGLQTLTLSNCCEIETLS